MAQVSLVTSKPWLLEGAGGGGSGGADACVDALLAAAAGGALPRLESAVCRVRGDFAGMLRACLADRARGARDALRLARALLADPALRAQRAALGAAVAASLPALAAASPREAALLLADAAPRRAAAAARALAGDPARHWAVLRCLARLPGEGETGARAGALLDPRAQEPPLPPLVLNGHAASLTPY